MHKKVAPAVVLMVIGVLTWACVAVAIVSADRGQIIRALIILSAAVTLIGVAMATPWRRIGDQLRQELGEILRFEMRSR